MDSFLYESLDFESKEDRITFLNQLKKDDLSVKQINKVLSFHSLDYYDDLDYLIELYSKSYSVNLEHLKSLCRIASFEVLKNLDNRNILSLLNADDKNFNRFISLFKDENIKLDEHSLNNIFEAFAQRAFVVNNHEIVTSFTATLNFIKRKEYVNARNKIIRVFKNKFDLLEKSEYDVDLLLNSLIKGDKKALDFYHNVCNKKIDEERNNYVKNEIEIYKNDYLDRYYEVNQSVKVISNYFDYDTILKYALKVKNFSEKEKLLLENKYLMQKLMNYKIESSNEISTEEKKNLYVFNSLLSKIYLKNKHDRNIENLLHDNNVKKIYKIPDIDRRLLLDVICNVDFEKILIKLSDDEYYNGLSEMLNRYKFLSFNSDFYNIEVESDTYCDALTISSILTNYDEIQKRLSSLSRVNMTTILDIADMYSDISKKYELLFEEDNYKYLTINPAPNKSIYSKNERRKMALNYLKESYSRNEISIPSFDKDYHVNGKIINVIVGNFTNPINLTLGERTGSCARIGGLADSLFDFCINNPNGFNIVFESSDGKFVSKVCGFRNGNTIFLNQLRESVTKDYTNNDLVKAIEQVSNDLIEMSKNSKHPIENIIISEEKAMLDTNHKVKRIGFNSFFEKLGQEFWTDVSKKYAIVLKTSKNNNELCEFKPGEKNSDMYVPVRSKISFSKNPTRTVARMKMLNEVLSDKKIEDIEIKYEPYRICYYGEDWYIAIDEKGNIVTKILEGSRDRMIAQKEFNVALESILSLNNIFEDKSLTVQ